MKTAVSWEGWKVKGMPVYTIVRGNVVMRNGKVMGKPQGRLVTPIDHKPEAPKKKAAPKPKAAKKK